MRVASATMLSGMAGFFSSRSSISRRARSETWLATFRNRFSTYSRSSSLTGVLRPLTSICMETLSSVDEAFTQGTPRSDLSQRSCVGERRYLQRPVRKQLPRTGAQSGAGGVHVVDENDGPGDRTAARAGPAPLGEPVGAAGARLARGGAGAPQARLDGQAGPLPDR